MENYDIHIHTHLSSCAARNACVSDYIAAAEEIGLDLIGFADHAWDESIKGASPWYANQGYKRLAERNKALSAGENRKTKVLFGAEGEFASMLLGLGDEGAEFVDYILIPHSHTHMKGFVLPDECIGDPEKHAKYLINSFVSLCGHEKRALFFGIVHPMYPIGESQEYVERIYSFITESALDECAHAAKEAGLFLEANLSVLKEIPPESMENHCYRRFLNACKRAGCNFFIGSDAHSIDVLRGNHFLKDDIIVSAGLAEADFITAKRRILNV